MSLSLSFILFVMLGILGFIIYSEHPVSMGFWFILFAVMVCVWVGLEWSSYIGYVMFFVYVGALLVMFCMVVSLAPNPVFRVVPFSSLLPFVGWMVMEDSWVESIYKSCSEDILGSPFSGLGAYDGFGWGNMLVLLSLVLLLGMISVVSMCKWNAGPLVRFNYKSSDVY